MPGRPCLLRIRIGGAGRRAAARPATGGFSRRGGARIAADRLRRVPIRHGDPVATHGLDAVERAVRAVQERAVRLVRLRHRDPDRHRHAELAPRRRPHAAASPASSASSASATASRAANSSPPIRNSVSPRRSAPLSAAAIARRTWSPCWWP